MPEITLLSERQSRPGFEFVYMGGAPVCRTCPYRHACLTLDVGRKYTVTRVRPIQHPCALQETTANVVEVQAVARPLVVSAGSAVAGSSIEIGRYECRRIDCPNWDICAGPAVPPRQKYRIERVHSEPTECRIGRTLRKVEVI
ncbi:MAG TPA: UPF0179 family protein [Thermoplasmata archaeon]|nr:UPF0179 family protein [Thermoplasmata archaeon]